MVCLQCCCVEEDLEQPMETVVAFSTLQELCIEAAPKEIWRAPALAEKWEAPDPPESAEPDPEAQTGMDDSGLPTALTVAGLPTNVGAQRTTARIVDRETSVDSVFISNRLQLAKEAAKRRRWRVSGPTMAIGALLMPASYVLWVAASWGSVLRLIGNVGAASGSIFALLAVLPSDRRIISHVAKAFVLLLLAVLAWNLLSILRSLQALQVGACTWSDRDISCAVFGIGIAVQLAFVVILLACVSYVVYCWRRGPARTLPCLWFVCGAGFFGAGATQCALAIVGLAVSGSNETDWLSLLGGVSDAAIGLCVARLTDFRENVQDWFASRGEVVATAAGIAEFVGGHGVHDLVEEARASFLCVSCDRITQQDLADNKPNPRLQELAEKARFGKVDAFLSHSWHDDPDQKWEAFQVWRADFKARQHREPTLWIDKYCINQRNIQESLRCLPVYLAGCKKLVALCGHTYITRLWCLIEIFVFMEMGGHAENLEVWALSEDLSLDYLDPRQAVCTTDEDSARLRGVLESGLNGSKGFTDLLKTSVRISPAATARARAQRPLSTPIPTASSEVLDLGPTVKI